MKKRDSINKTKLINWVNRFAGVRVLVIGDVMVDRAVRGNVERLSPEAPVPIIDIKEEIQTPGGAGNVVNNILALGGIPSLISVRGADSNGQFLEDEFRYRGVDVSGLFVDETRPTITKTRILASQQQIVRLDWENKSPLSSTLVSSIIKEIRNGISKFNVILLSDYGKGVITPPVIKTVVREAHRHGSLVIVDPKVEHFLNYKGVDCLTPNTKEAIEGIRSLMPKSELEFENLGWKIIKRLKAKSLLITRGELGMSLFEKKKIFHIPTKAREVFDVTGAGDTVVSTYALARAINVPSKEAAQIANYAASLVVAKLGTAVAHQKDLVRLLKTEK